MSADDGTSFNVPRPRVAADHSLTKVSLSRATLASRAATSDGSSLVLTPSSPVIGSTPWMRAVKLLGSRPLRATSNGDQVLRAPRDPVHVTSCRPGPAGMSGAGYVKLRVPVTSALPASVLGGPSPKTPGSTFTATSQLSPGCVFISSAP